MIYQHWLHRSKNISEAKYEIPALNSEDVQLVFEALNEAKVYEDSISGMQISNKDEIEREVKVMAII